MGGTMSFATPVADLKATTGFIGCTMVYRVSHSTCPVCFYIARRVSYRVRSFVLQDDVSSW